MVNFWRTVLMLLITCCQGLVLQAQVLPLRFESYSTENGLPQNSGYCIAQTNEGFMWFGTQNGLCRSDGYQLKVYKKDASDSLSICNNLVRALVTDASGNLWIGTPAGISIYQPVTDRFYKPSVLFKTPPNIDLLFVTGFVKDRTGNIWIQSNTGKLFKYSPRNNSLQQYQLPIPAGRQLRRIAVDGSNRIWISTDDDLYLLKGDVFQPFHMRQYLGNQTGLLDLRDMAFTHDELWVSSNSKGIFRLRLTGSPVLLAHINTDYEYCRLDGNEIETLVSDSNGDVWFGTPASGVYIYHYNTGRFENGRHSDKDVFSLKRNYVISLFEDKQKLMWIGLSGGGVARFDANKNFFRNILLTEKITYPLRADNMVLNIYNDGDSALYIGTQAAGIVKTTAAFSDFEIFAHDDTDSTTVLHDLVYSFAKDNRRRLWVGTIAGLCSMAPSEKNTRPAFTSYAGNQATAPKSIVTIVKLKHLDALLMGGINGLFMFNLQTNQWMPLPDAEGYTLAHKVSPVYMTEVQDEPGTKGTVLLACDGRGLVAYNYLSGSFKEYTGVGNISATARFVKKVGHTLWVGTDNGLVEATFNGYNAARQYGKDNGLNDEVVYAILPDKKGQLWLSTNHGLSCFDHAKKMFINYGNMHGLGNAEFNSAACAAMPDGQLLFGGVNGVTGFYPDQVPYNSYSPVPLITGVDVMNKAFLTPGNITFTKSISLNYNENFVTLHFAAPNFSQTEHTVYKYKMNGINKDWVDAGSSTIATYTNLPPGNYTFELRSANNEGLWNAATTTLLITIHPPFWGSWWFIMLAVIFIGSMIYLFFRERIARIKINAAAEKKLSDYEMKALHAQMNPHFIFNCLNSIKEMILVGDNANASRYLSSFAQLIRDTLNHSQQTFISLRQSLVHLERYIKMEHIRIDDFVYNISIDPALNLDEIKISPMLLQPLVENAIWYGMSADVKQKVLQLNLRAEGDNVCIIIEDNGPGIHSVARKENAEGKESVAISNIRKRIVLLNEKFGIGCSLQITDKADSDNKNGSTGTVVKLLIPLETNY